MHAESTPPRRSLIRTRIFSFGVLGALAAGLTWGAAQGYRAATDSFVAPIILSPDNDLVLTNKLKLSEIEIERTRAVAELEAVDLDLRESDKMLARLEELRKKSEHALAWTVATTRQTAASGAAERRRVREEAALLKRMKAEQEQRVERARADVEAGVLSRTEYAKEMQSLQHLHLATFENEHSRIQSELVLGQVRLTERSLSSNGAALAMPEIIAREEQMVRIELEIVRLGEGRRARAGERRVTQEKLAKIDELDAQLRARPIFQATSRSMDVAFVPYTQLEGVRGGAAVYDCVWGLFHCQPVGTVAEVVPGEVILPDPWGNQARGQYAVLDLKERGAARSRSLRVRASTAAGASAPVVTLSPRAQRGSGG
jgi:hypothetical protein